MAKHKVSELEGAKLDEAVAKALGWAREGEYWMRTLEIEGEPNVVSCHPIFGISRWKPSAEWEQGGPIIERERMYVAHTGERWEAGAACEYGHEGPECNFYGYGPTLLIAAMRAYVASKLGEEIDL